MVIIDGGGDESLKSGEREIFVGGGGRRDGRCVSKSVVVDGETRQRRGLSKQLRAMRY